MLVQHFYSQHMELDHCPRVHMLETCALLVHNSVHVTTILPTHLKRVLMQTDTCWPHHTGNIRNALLRFCLLEAYPISLYATENRNGL